MFIEKRGTGAQPDLTRASNNSRGSCDQTRERHVDGSPRILRPIDGVETRSCCLPQVDMYFCHSPDEPHAIPPSPPLLISSSTTPSTYRPIPRYPQFSAPALSTPGFVADCSRSCELEVYLRPACRYAFRSAL